MFYNIYIATLNVCFILEGDILDTDEYKELIFKTLEKIQDTEALKRIYNLVSYIYINKAGK